MQYPQKLYSMADQHPKINVYVRVLPQSKLDRQKNFLVTSIDIQRKKDYTDYWVTFLGDQSQQINGLEFCSMIQKLHDRISGRSHQRIVSFIEYGDAPKRPSNRHDPSARNSRTFLNEKTTTQQREDIP